jgi:mannose-1-phosphate guanylyltransferase
MQQTYIAIMAGGVGSRFWPGSREAQPKQFLDMLGVGKSLLRLTFERFLPIAPAAHILVVTNAAYKDLVKEHLPELEDHQILCEPSRNNTAPCIAYAAHKLASLDPDANMVVAPSDHIVLQEEAFLSQILKAVGFAAHHNALLTLGITPTRPDTGYGYIQFGARAELGSPIHQVVRFTEKPDLEHATAFVQSGRYLWNAGIFVWNVQSILKALDQHAPEISDIFKAGAHLFNTPEEQPFIDRVYPGSPNISVDFAIMEKATNVYTLPSAFGWSDLGTWASLHAECPKDPEGNALQGTIIARQSSGCMVSAPPGKLVVLQDQHDLIVIDREDVLMIIPRNQEQAVKDITGQVKQIFNGKYL